MSFKLRRWILFFGNFVSIVNLRVSTWQYVDPLWVKLVSCLKMAKRQFSGVWSLFLHGLDPGFNTSSNEHLPVFLGHWLNAIAGGRKEELKKRLSHFCCYRLEIPLIEFSVLAEFSSKSLHFFYVRFPFFFLILSKLSHVYT